MPNQTSVFFLSVLFFILTKSTCANLNPLDNLLKRDTGYHCEENTSAICPSYNTVDPQGLTPLQVLYFGMLNTSLPDSTFYNDGELVICIGPKQGPTIQFTASAGVTAGPASAGVTVSFNTTVPPINSGSKLSTLSFLL